VRERERTLRGRDLDDRVHVDVAMRDELPAPVPVGMDFRMSSRGAGDTRNNERGERQRRLVDGQETLSVGHVDVEQPVHWHHSLARAHRRRHQATIRRKRMYLDPTPTIRGHGATLPPTACRTKPIWRVVAASTPCSGFPSTLRQTTQE
jgi:hypothetical protein